jgi:thiol-disulfide isomerase/thioredoxin
MKIIIPVIIASLLFAVPLAGCKQSKSQNGPSNSSVTSLLTDTDNNDDTGGWGLSINTTDLYGTKITSKSLSENNLTVLNIWATWCPPCIQELPELQKISDAFAEQDVQVIGVLQDGVTELGVPNKKTIKNALKLLENANASYTVIIPDETLMREFINTMRYFPTTFFIDSGGTVIHTVIGSNNFDGWSNVINEILKQKS